MPEDESTLFTRLLVARHSPQNRCHAKDGEVLIVTPKTPLPTKDAAHHFVSASLEPGRCLRLRSRR